MTPAFIVNSVTVAVQLKLKSFDRTFIIHVLEIELNVLFFNIDIGKVLHSIKHVVLVLSGKGGVGKSTVATQIAWVLYKKGKKVGWLGITKYVVESG